MTKQELIENIKQFNIENYYSEDTTGINENSAVLIITDNQFILTKSSNDGKEVHAITFSDIYQIIYDINDLNLSNMNKMTKTIRINTQYGKENITARMLNENNQKLFLLHFPEYISRNQYQLLEYFNELYGNILSMLTLEEKQPFIGIENTPVIPIANFEEVIEYASARVSDSITSTYEDRNIVGKTVSTFSSQK